MTVNYFYILLLGLVSLAAGQQCDPSFAYVGSKCLYVNYTAGDVFTWENAREFCQNLHANADLATYPTCEQFEEFSRYMAMNDPREKNVWVGARSVFSPADWEWVTLEPLQTGVPFWYYLEDYHGRKGCAASIAHYYYRLYADDCLQKKGVACTYTPDATSKSVEKPSEPKAQITCPGDGILIGDGCYCFHPVAKTFSQAEEGCRDEYSMYGGELYYPTSCEEFQKIAHHAEAAELQRSYWVGAKDVRGDQEWTWVNGDEVPAEFPYWATGRPRVHNDGKQYCGSMNPKLRYYLLDEPCTDVHNYICRINSE